MMASSRKKLPPEVQAALDALAAIFRREAVKVVEQRMDEEDRQRQQKPIGRIRLTRPYMPPVPANAVTTPRAPATEPTAKEM
jgi:hypothetical protein